MNIIVAVTRRWGIGTGEDLLFHLPDDMKYFRRMTLGKTVIMGRRTLESFPGKKPLPGRRNIVLTRDKGFICEGAEILHSPAEVFSSIEGTNPEDVFVIGGGEIYRLLLPMCQRAYVTHIDADAPATVFFPDLSLLPEWTMASASEPVINNGVSMRFCVYEQSRPTISQCAECLQSASSRLK